MTATPRRPAARGRAAGRPLHRARAAPQPPVGGEALRRLRRCRLGPPRLSASIPADPRWELGSDRPARRAPTGTARQPAEIRAPHRAARHRRANMKTGLQFESVLKRGLLEYAFRLPNGSPEFRYVYHEVIEEAQHSLMFQEFVNRTGLDIPGLPWELRSGAAASSAWPAGSRRCSSCSSSAARIRSITCSAPPCAAARRCIRCSSGSCASTSPRRRGTSRSPATTCGPTCRSCRPGGGARHGHAGTRDPGHRGERHAAPAPPPRPHLRRPRCRARATPMVPDPRTGRTPRIRSARSATSWSSSAWSRRRRSACGSAWGSGTTPDTRAPPRAVMRARAGAPRSSPCDR